MRVSLSLLLLSCAARFPALPPVPPEVTSAPAVIALVGASRPPAQGLVDDIRGADPAWVVLVGDAMAEATPRAADAALRSWEGLGVVWVPGEGERTGPQAARAKAALWPRGAWGSFDVQTAAGPVRWVVVDASAPRDQGFWLPGVVGAEQHATVLIVGSEAADVVASARDAAPPDRLAAVVTGGGGVNALRLPEGPWGLGRVEAGDGGGASATLPQQGLAEGFRAALIDAFAVDAPASRALHEQGAAFAPPPFATTGWWRVEVQADGVITWSLRRRGADGAWATVHTARWSRAAGWAY